jgi:hypothetical protein
MAPRSTAENGVREPRNLPVGVRAADMITGSYMGCYSVAIIGRHPLASQDNNIARRSAGVSPAMGVRILPTWHGGSLPGHSESHAISGHQPALEKKLKFNPPALPPFHEMSRRDQSGG